MALAFADPFDALFRYQGAGPTAREWLARRHDHGDGRLPPINVFQQGTDFVAIIEMRV
jgi:hypothetical protein